MRKFGTLLFLCLLSACSLQEDAQKRVEETTVTETVDINQNKFAVHDEDLEKTVRLEPGPYSGDNYDEQKVKNLIDEFPKEAEEEEYFYRLLELVAEDYRPFQEFIDEIDTSFTAPSDVPDGELGAAPESLKVNVQILLDASGSMGALLDGTPKMDLAKEAVQSFVNQLPDSINVSLRVYGHEGTTAYEDRELSCMSTEEVYPLGPYEAEPFTEALQTFSPAGWTPLAASMIAAKDDLTDDAKNIVYIVSDGIETCDGDPVQAAKDLNQSSIGAMVNIIGFDVDDEGQQALKEVADAGEGIYETVQSHQELVHFFERERRRMRLEWLKWSNENVSHYIQSQNERVNELFAVQQDMTDKTRVEQARLEDLSEYIIKTMGIEGRELKRKVFHRAVDLRRYAFRTSYPYRQELREKGFENRQQIRDRANEERERLKEEN